MLLSCGTQKPSDFGLVTDGAVLRNPSDTKIYLISGGKRHYIQTPGTVQALGVAAQVKDASDAVINSVPLGDALPPLTTNAIQKPSTGEVFVLEAGKRRYVPDPETLAALHLTDKIHSIADGAADMIPLGAPLPHTANKK
jgi:hypothetical protein